MLLLAIEKYWDNVKFSIPLSKYPLIALLSKVLVLDGELSSQEIIGIKKYSKCVLIMGTRLWNIKALQVKLPRNLFAVVLSPL